MATKRTQRSAKKAMAERSTSRRIALACQCDNAISTAATRKGFDTNSTQ
jgi:hypothetical protein